MARKKKPQKIPVALAASLVAHALLVLVLVYFIRTPISPKRGLISVEFIESVRHDPKPAPRFRSKAPPRTDDRPQLKDSPPPQLPLPSIGDPSALARETDTYIQSVLEKINKRKAYPPESLAREEEGRVVLGVSVLRDGRVAEVHVEESSRFQRLDEAALNIVSQISSFEPLPEVIEAPLHLHIPIVYKMESRP